LWAPERAQPGFGWRARVACVPTPGPPAREPNCPFYSRGAYPVKSMLITAICGAPGLLTELGYSFSPILPLNCFLVKLYTGAYGLLCNCPLGQKSPNSAANPVEEWIPAYSRVHEGRRGTDG